MSVSNRVTLAKLEKMTAEQIQSISRDELVMLTEDLAQEADILKRRKGIINSEVSRRYIDAASTARRAENKDTGIVNIPDGEYIVKADLKKEVDWNQAELRKAVHTLQHEWNEDITEYVSIEIKVSENKFKSWPSKIRALFEPARTVKAGTQTFEFKPAKKAA